MIYYLALPKQSGGQTVINDRRAALVVLPENTEEEEALAVARGIVAEADPSNGASWAGATGGFVTTASLDDAGGIAWFDTTPESPAVLVGGPDTEGD